MTLPFAAPRPLWLRLSVNLASSVLAAALTAQAALPAGRDTTFQTQALDGLANAALVLPDGKILIGGAFTTVGGVARPGLARLNADGSLDASFAPPIAATGTYGKPVVTGLLRQADGSILAAGQPSFFTTGAVVRTNIIRFTAAGAVDPSFNANAASLVAGFAVQPDGKVLYSTFLTSGAAYGPIRLNADGSTDSSFHYTTGIQKGLQPLQFQVQGDGHILVLEGDNNPSVSGIQNLVWLKGDGSLDSTFKFPFQLQDESRFAVASDGSLLVAGYTAPPANFTPQIQRVAADGTADSNFIFLTQPNNQGVHPVPAAFLPDGGAVLVRNPTAGDRRVSFFYLTSAGKLAGSLDLANAGNLPGLGTQTTRAFAMQPDGKLLFSQVFVDGTQNVFGMFRLPPPPAPVAPLITVQPESKTIGAGETLFLGVTASSTSPMTYQWKHAGTNLPAQTGQSLTLGQDSKERAGEFVVIVSNAFGSIPSQVATITVRPPAPMVFTVQPVGGSVKLSQSFTFSATYTTEVTTGYQWYKNQIPLATGAGQGFGSTVLSLAANDASRVGDYFVVITNAFGGAITSAVVHLDVILPGPPQLTVQPQDLALFSAQPVQLNVAAIGDGTLTYQWQHAGTNLKTSATISGVTGPTLVVSGTNPDRFGAYSVVVTLNPGGSTTSRVAQVTQLPAGPPVLLSQPQGFTVNFGQSTNVSAAFNGEAPLTLYWLHAGTNVVFSRGLPGLTLPTLDGPSTNAYAFAALPSTAGTYQFVASNRFGSVTSSVVAVTVTPPTPLTLLRDLSNAVVGIGEFNAVALRQGLVVTNLGNAETTHLLAFRVEGGLPPFRGTGDWQLALGVSNRYYIGENSGAAAAVGTWGYLPGGDNYFALTNFPRVGDVARLEAYEDGRYGIILGGNTAQFQSGTYRVLGNRRPATNTFTVEVISSNQVAFRWMKDGLPLTRLYTTTTTPLGAPPAVGGVNERVQISLADLQPSDAGVYSVDIENWFPNPDRSPGQPAYLVTSISHSSAVKLTIRGYTETNAPPVLSAIEFARAEPTALSLLDDRSLLLGAGTTLSLVTPDGRTNWQKGNFPAPIRAVLTDGLDGAIVGGHTADSGDWFLQRIRPTNQVVGGKTNLLLTNLWSAAIAGPSTNFIDTSGIVHGAELAALLPTADGVLVAGRFRGQTRFGVTNVPYIAGLFFPLGGTTLTNSATAAFDRSWDLYLAKFDLAGKLLWVRGYGGVNDERVASFTTNNAGELFLSGSFKGIAKFGSLTVESTKRIDSGTVTNYATDGFIAKLAADGTPIWVKRLGGLSNGFLADTQIASVVTDGAGNIVLSATRNQTSVSLQPGVTVGAHYLARLNPDGELQWAQTVEAAGNVDSFAGVGGSRLALDSEGNVYLSDAIIPNAFSLPITLGAAGIDRRLAAGTLLAKMAPNGSLLWARTLDEKLPFADDARTANTRFLAATPAGELVLVGSMSGGTTSSSTHSAGQRMDTIELYTTNSGSVVPTVLYIARLAPSFVPEAPKLTVLPMDQTGLLQDSLTLSGVATGVPAPTFQWLRNGTPISGATNRLLTFTDLERTNVGHYSLVVSNAYGSVTSPSADVTPQLRPTMTGWTLVTATTNYLGAPAHVGADDAGNVYAMLVGWANGGILDFRKFDAAGNFLWRFNDHPDAATTYLLSPLAPVVANSGEVFIAGRAINQPSQISRSEGNFLARLNPADGTLLWVKSLGSVAVGQIDTATVRLLDLDHAGQVRVITADNLGTTRAVRSFRFDGTETTGPARSFLPTVRDVNNGRYALDAAGSLYFSANRVEALNLGGTNTAALGGNGAQSFVVARYDATGAFQWVRTFTGPNGGVVHVPTLATDSGNNLLLAGEVSLSNGQTLQVGTNQLSSRSFIAKVTATGDIAWAKGTDLVVRDTAVGTDDSLYLAGWFRFAPAPFGAVTRKVPFGTNYVAGSSITGHDLFVAKLGPDGTERFIRQSGSPEFATEDNATAYAIAVDSRGVVTTGGYTRVPHAGGGLDLGELRFVWPNLNPYDIANSGGDLPSYYLARLEVDVTAVTAAEIGFEPPAPGSTTLRLTWPPGFRLQRQTALVGGAWETLSVPSPYDASIAEFSQGFFRVIPNP